MRVTLFQPCKVGVAVIKQLDLDFSPFPGLEFSESSSSRYSRKVKSVRCDIPTGSIVAVMAGELTELEVELLRHEGWEFALK